LTDFDFNNWNLLQRDSNILPFQEKKASDLKPVKNFVNLDLTHKTLAKRSNTRDTEDDFNFEEYNNAFRFEEFNYIKSKKIFQIINSVSNKKSNLTPVKINFNDFESTIKISPLDNSSNSLQAPLGLDSQKSPMTEFQPKQFSDFALKDPLKNSTSSIFRPGAKNKIGSRSGSLSFFSDAVVDHSMVKPNSQSVLNQPEIKTKLDNGQDEKVAQLDFPKADFQTNLAQITQALMNNIDKTLVSSLLIQNYKHVASLIFNPPVLKPKNGLDNLVSAVDYSKTKNML